MEPQHGVKGEVQGSMTKIEKTPIHGMTVRQAFDQILRAADLCFQNMMIIPALILLYSGIDIAAGLFTEDSDGEVRRKHFIKWVNHYIMPQGTLNCTAEDLYGARCGLTHGFTPISNLSKKANARQIYYAYGTSDHKHLSKLITLVGMTDRVAIHANQVLAAVREGIDRFLHESSCDERLAKRIKDRSRQMFGSMTDEQIAELDDWTTKKLAD